MDGKGNAARFSRPVGLAVDNAENVYVADSSNHTIRVVSPAGVVTTLAGLAGNAGNVDGVGGAARFSSPSAVAVDDAGFVYVADTGNQTIRKVSPTGLVTTLAGGGILFSSSGGDGVGSGAGFGYPAGLAVDGAGNVYVADSTMDTIRKVTPAGVVTTLAGTPGVRGSADGTGAAAQFDFPFGVAVDGAGNIYVSDAISSIIRQVSLTGVVTTIAGKPIQYGGVDGVGTSARFDYPYGVAVDGQGNIYVADSSNDTIRRVAPGGIVTTLAGLVQGAGAADGTLNQARLFGPSGVAVSSSGNLYVADTYNNTIRKITTNGMVTTLAGLAASSGDVDGPGHVAEFNAPSGVATDSAGNIYVADAGNNSIRKVTPAGVVTTILVGTGDTNAPFSAPSCVAMDAAGNLYFAESGNTIRKATPNGVVTTLAGLRQLDALGNPIGGNSDGLGSAARFNRTSGLALDSAGNVYVADKGNNSIRKLTPAGLVTTLAGSSQGSADGSGSAARFSGPSGIAVDHVGYVYVADAGNGTIRKVTPDGQVTTLAGVALQTGSNDGLATSAHFNSPSALAVDGAGNLYVSDTRNCAIRKVTPSGTVTTLAGMAGLIPAGTLGQAGSFDGTGSLARFDLPTGIAVDNAGNIYVADQNNNTLRKGVPAPSGVLSFGPISGSTGGPFGFAVTAGATQSIVVEASLDLRTWASVWTNSGPGSQTFIDAQASAYRNRFYRTRSP